jgi:membrane protein implicated in regulation of membrane protease activity
LIELLQQVNYWHWIAFGLLLLSGELLGTAGYFLWLGISAVLVGLILTVLPVSWQLQWVSFAVFSLVTTWLWWRYQHKQDRSANAKSVLNQRERQMIGKTTRLAEDVQRGNCRIRLGDTTWSAKSEQDIPAGTLIKVVDVEGIILFIEPLE